MATPSTPVNYPPSNPAPLSTNTDDQHKHQSWTRDDYLVSTDPSLIDPVKVNTWYAAPDMYWAAPVPEASMAIILQTSVWFGLYHTPTNEFIGIARLITDRVTFAYLTDVYIPPARRASGLGRWLITCVREHLDAMPCLRTAVMFTSDWARSVPFYEQLVGVNVHPPLEGWERGKEGMAVLLKRGPGHPANVA